MAASRHSLPPSAEGPTSKIVVPVRYAAWLSGDLGRTLERTLQHALDPLEEVRVTRLPRGFLVEANEAPGPLLEAVHRAALDLEKGVEAAYPVFHHEMGPVWTGTLQAVFEPAAATA
jgi:hypothetical protein